MHKSFQYGSKSFPFVVESTADVKDDFCFREQGMHVWDLPGEVVFLFLTTEEAVTDCCWVWRLLPAQSGN
ncbi:hypothetical protein BJP36_40250 [Moorena producens JHB]|uniref:Uncharacterized protein n=1 Tax=Moorena producens (strain JHB) TaxID=1454205 RepID=A0A9Q9SS48_MOOP1|nr:hypothetical protein [Moorena producens]WAN68606.1 hypothetical protein BJP36_40250 [Moorena producens JHB]